MATEIYVLQLSTRTNEPPVKAAQGCRSCLRFISPGADMAKMLAGKVALITGGLPKAMVLQKVTEQ